MQNELNDEEIIIDFKKVFNIILYRKDLIIKVFVFFLIFFALLTLITPKRYKSTAEIYVNKTNNTNLSEVNPYVIASLANIGGGLSGMLGGGINNLQNEIEIMTSPLVMDNVIKENNLRYGKGKKKGELLSSTDFVRGGPKIEIKKGTNVISISFRAGKPKKAHDVINSIINNYKKVNTDINIEKAGNDKELLEKSYRETEKSLNKKLANMKNTSTLPTSGMTALGPITALRGHSKIVGGILSSIQTQVIEGQKAQISVDQEVEKLKLVKTKLEWTNLVKELSQGSTNVIVLKEPEIRRDFEYSSPKLWLNMIFAILLGFAASLILVILKELTDKKLTYSDLSEKVIYDVKDNLDDLKTKLLASPKENITIAFFEGFDTGLLSTLNEFSNIKVSKADLNPSRVSEILNSNQIIFAAKIGITGKKVYNQFKNICNETQKPILLEII